jgi:hypothetical protein
MSAYAIRLQLAAITAELHGFTHLAAVLRLLLEKEMVP